MLFEIITTVFDAAMIFLLLMYIFTDSHEEKKYKSFYLFFIVIYVMNLFCIWGLR